MGKRRQRNLFNILFAGVFLSEFFMFYPVHHTLAEGTGHAVLLSLFTSMQVFTIGCEYGAVREAMAFCGDSLDKLYQIWAAVLFVLAPVFTFSFVLSLFKDLTASVRYLAVYFRDVYIFSELNDRALALASDIRKNHPKAAIVFTSVFEEEDETSYELAEAAGAIRGICFKRDIIDPKFKRHCRKSRVSFFAIGMDETENLDQSLHLIEMYGSRDNAHLYVFSTNVEGELLLTAISKGKIKVRRINQVRSLINRVLFEQGEIFFEGARPMEDGTKRITAVVLGMGHHGTEMVKALAWYGQMDGYELVIHGFDRDPLAEDRFVALTPELMSPRYNGVKLKGEAQYTIGIHPSIDTDTAAFAAEFQKLRETTYVLVALGNDHDNIRTAVAVRMYCERMGIHPVIQTILYNSRQKNALEGIKNYRGQMYDIEFIGDIESSYTEAVVIDSDLEEIALARHLRWGVEDEFWTYEYNYRSSVASAIHLRARCKCGIPGANKTEEELTPEEREGIETLE
ncbi:MAG: hypothetical protein IKM59_03770, partial [Oscillospiraceae bacterium]|nr:hypothetical protein [Oscillospiraceae bacterium]